MADVQMQSPDLSLNLRECPDGLHTAAQVSGTSRAPETACLSAFRVGNKGGALHIPSSSFGCLSKMGNQGFSS